MADGGTRWGGVPKLAALLVLALALLELAAHLTLPPAPKTFDLLRRLDAGARGQAGQRLAGALADSGADARRFGVIAGLSSIREGIDPDALAFDDRRWLVLATGGGMMRQLDDLLRPLLTSDVTPAAVVLGLHPEWLADQTEHSLARGVGPWVDPRSPIERALWIVANRGGMTLLGHDLMDRARERLLPALGVDPLAMYGRTDEPFAPLHVETVDHASPGHLRDQMNAWTERGWFDPTLYRTDGIEAQTLGVLLDRLAARTRVLVVIMPASPQWRARTPDAARAALHDVLAAHLPAADILDASALLDDRPGLMFDHSHVNAGGRDALTLRLRTWLAERLRP